MENQQSKQWLPISWKVMAGWGVLYIFFAIMVPLVSVFVNPALFVYGSEDAAFVGNTWSEIVAFSPGLGSWIVLTMVSMCAMMIGLGILQVGIAAQAYRRGERWAWRNLLWANLLSFLYNVGIFIPFASRGLYGISGPIPSGVAIGIPFLVIWAVVLIFGLWLPRKELRD